MRSFALYTLARAGLFVGCYATIWLIIGSWVEWDSLNALSTAMLALVVSSVLAFKLLTPLRDSFAAHVAARADRAKAAFDARRRAEDADEF